MYVHYYFFFLIQIRVPQELSPAILLFFFLLYYFKPSSLTFVFSYEVRLFTFSISAFIVIFIFRKFSRLTLKYFYFPTSCNIRRNTDSISLWEKPLDEVMWQIFNLDILTFDFPNSFFHFRFYKHSRAGKLSRSFRNNFTKFTLFWKWNILIYLVALFLTRIYTIPFLFEQVMCNLLVLAFVNRTIKIAEFGFQFAKANGKKLLSFAIFVKVIKFGNFVFIVYNVSIKLVYYLNSEVNWVNFTIKFCWYFE